MEMNMTVMTRKQAKYLASFDPDYEARPLRSLVRQMPFNWVVWSVASDHVVEFYRLPALDPYGEILTNRSDQFIKA